MARWAPVAPGHRGYDEQDEVAVTGDGCGPTLGPGGNAVTKGWDLTGASTPASPKTDDVETTQRVVIPELPTHFLRRGRLDRRLADATRRRLTVVTGPPGSGKTVMLTGWARSPGPVPVRWLSLEPVDNNPRRFWRDVILALRLPDPRARRALLGAVSRGEPAADLADRLSADSLGLGPAALVIDNLDHIDDPDILASLDYLVRHLPRRVSLVVSSRQSPPLPCHRLRLWDELAEIREQDLRFTADEAAAFLAMAAPGSFQEIDVARLTVRTEGWAAGLQMAAIAVTGPAGLAGAVGRGRAGGDPVADYLAKEVVGGQSADVISFLVTTSVLEVVSAELSEQLTGRTDAGEILQSLAEHNSFVIELDAGPGYRYHHLLRDYLRRRFRLEAPGAERDAHLAAAAWFEARGEHREALGHLAAAGEHDRAFAVGLSIAPCPPVSWSATDLGSVLCAALPPGYIEADATRTYVVAAAMLLGYRSEAAAPWIRRLERAVAQGGGRDPGRRRVEALWAIHDGIRGAAGGALRHWRRHQELAGAQPGTTARPDPEPELAGSRVGDLDAAVTSELLLFAARAHLWRGDPASARATLDIRFHDDVDFDHVPYLSVRAMVALWEGRLHDAAATGRKALEEAERHGLARDPAAAEARLALAGVLFERGDLDAAEHHLEEARSLCQDFGQGAWTAACATELVGITLARGRPEPALDQLHRIRESLPDDVSSAYPLPRLDEIEYSCRLALGDLEGATLTLKSLAPQQRTPVALARLDLCAARPDRVVERLAPRPGPRCPRPLREEIERLALMAGAHLQLGDRHRAEDGLRRAVDLSRPERFIQVYLDEVPGCLPLLRSIAGRYPDAYLSELLARAVDAGSAGDATTARNGFEPLTDRERELLGYLPSHLSQHEIANAMYISLNTVKTHLKGIYRKFGARSRSEAVAMARANHLLQPRETAISPARVTSRGCGRREGAL
jgi:LuxR family maltose regulon positive regulatory protein